MEEPSNPPTSTGARRGPTDWRFRGLLVVGVIAVGYVLLWHGLTVHQAIAANLPLLLPLAVTVLSIFTRVSDIRDYESVLKISNDIAIGIISFDIWALSASRSDASGRVLVNSAKMIRGDFVMPFLLFGLLLAVGCVVLTHYSFSSDRTRRMWLIGALFASILVYVAPFGVLEPIPAAKPAEPTARLRSYTVVVPYQDPTVIGIAPTILRDRVMVHFERQVQAASPDAAKAQAVQTFMQAPISEQVKRKGERVVIQNQNLVAVAN